MFAVIRRKPSAGGVRSLISRNRLLVEEIRRGVHFLDIQIPNKVSYQALDEALGSLAEGRIIAEEGLELPDSYILFNPIEFIREVLTCSAVRTAHYLSKTRKLVVALVDPYAVFGAYAFNFMAAASEVRIITNHVGKYQILSDECFYEFGQPLTLTREISAIRECHLIIAPVGMRGLVDSGVVDTRCGVIFTPCPEDFSGGLIVDGFLPGMGIFGDLCPPAVSQLEFCAACFSLCGLRGLAELTPRALYAGGRSIGFEDIVRAAGG